MKAIKYTIYAVVLAWIVLLLWGIFIEIRISDLRMKQTENDLRFGVMADALYLESEAPEKKDR